MKLDAWRLAKRSTCRGAKTLAVRPPAGLQERGNDAPQWCLEHQLPRGEPGLIQVVCEAMVRLGTVGVRQ
ncbi:hypothetical protein BTVI_151725 [Pitangus sulphuratus]|nr:hypothetical protein BTVI_151725 [Pitangus sulphuratus]